MNIEKLKQNMTMVGQNDVKFSETLKNDLWKFKINKNLYFITFILFPIGFRFYTE